MNATEQLASSIVPSPLGDLTVVVSPTGIRAVLWPDDGPERVRDAPTPGQREAPADGARRDIIDEAQAQLAAYFSGDATAFDLPLDPVGTDFQLAVWETLRQIPFGETLSYGEQAERLGDRNKARAVGAANGRNPISIIVPCHRVVGSTGSLTGFAGGIESKRFLLDHEQRVLGTTLL